MGRAQLFQFGAALLCFRECRLQAGFGGIEGDGLTVALLFGGRPEQDFQALEVCCRPSCALFQELPIRSVPKDKIARFEAEQPRDDFLERHLELQGGERPVRDVAMGADQMAHGKQTPPGDADQGQDDQRRWGENLGRKAHALY